jgi:para-nitrobenzyl esterase
VVDGELVPAAPYQSIARGAPSVRLLVGATGEEFNVTAAATPGGVDEARLERRLGRMGLGPDAIAAYRSSLPGAEPWRVLGQAVTDSTFKAPALRLADAWAGGGGAVHVYDFEWRTSVGDMGAVHCLDIPFAFDNLDAAGVEEVAGAGPPQALADDVHRSWVRFVVDGEPGWESYGPTRRPAMVFDETCKVVEDPWRLARTAGFSAGRP